MKILHWFGRLFRRDDDTPRQSLGRIFRNNAKILLKIVKNGPEYLLCIFINAVRNGVAGSAEAIYMVKLFDALDAGASFGEAAVIIGIMAAWLTINTVISRLHWLILMPWTKQKLDLRLHGELFAKARSIDVACYDDPEFYNDFVWAMDEASARSEEVINDLGNLLSNLISFSTLFTLLLSIDTGVAWVLLGASVLNMFLNQAANRLYYNREKESKPLSRVEQYISRVFQLPDYTKEIRISHVTDLLLEDLNQNTEKQVDVATRYGKKEFLLYGVFDNLVSRGVNFGILLYMFFELLAGNVLTGGFAASLTMLWRVQWNMADFVSKVSKFPKHSLFLEKYFGFLAYEPHIVSGKEALPPVETLELHDVSFRYDFSSHPKYEYHNEDWQKPEGEPEGRGGYALKHVNLTLRKGEKIAIVGYNGAGKTTLIKLLMRLYDPTDGKILMNGRDIREYDVDGYRDKIGTVFQDFQIFAASIAENVMNGIYHEETDKETVLAALDAAGFTEKLNKLEQGIDTPLTREFNPKGTNLSGGEGQKVAIARVFAKPYELIIMDEPSSALDPVAEYNLNRAILRYAADKTVIFISHRLSTTRMADRIYMFAEGQLCEEGSHDELMALNGKYAEMFNMQAQKYIEGEQ